MRGEALRECQDRTLFGTGVGRGPSLRGDCCHCALACAQASASTCILLLYAVLD